VPVHTVDAESLSKIVIHNFQKSRKIESQKLPRKRISASTETFLLYQYSPSVLFLLQCYDTVSWVTGRASGLKKMGVCLLAVMI